MNWKDCYIEAEKKFEKYDINKVAKEVATEIRGTKFPDYADFEDAVGGVVDKLYPSFHDDISGIGVFSRLAVLRNNIRKELGEI